MSDLQIYLTLAVFAGVILAIAFDVIDMAVAALLGVCVLIALGILHEPDMIEALRTAGGPLALLFGGMVVAHVLGKTGIFERVGRDLSARHRRQRQALPAPADRAGRAGVRVPAQRHHGDPARAGHHRAWRARSR